MTHVPTSIELARGLDHGDPLGSFRDRFHIPRRHDGSEEIYFCGHSLGLQPNTVAAAVTEELEAWAALGVRGHFEAPHPWMPYHRFLTEPMAGLVGALPEEVVVMNSLTTNLHLLMVSFYRPTSERHRVLLESHAFPSDHYAVESQIRFHGFDPAESMLLIRPREGEQTLRLEDLALVLEQHGHEIALVLLPGVQYYTGQALEIAEITRVARRKGCVVGFDLAHAAGNLELALHDWDVDFACWCTYKYLNGGPGSAGACFVHQRYAERFDLPRFAGWWGHDQETRFRMGSEFRPMRGAEGWQLSNPPILSLAAVRASLEVFSAAGGMGSLRAKSIRLTGFLEFLLRERLPRSIRIITSSDPMLRGCQLSLEIDSGAGNAREIFDRLIAGGVMVDWREPNVIRAAPVPLYNRYEDVWTFVDRLLALVE
ncbi:MAG TPA: kynureninase [Thermoanaerobaculia bacterium]|nr:kynureninase [Thermoanaerobaculia bacterium]